MTYTNIFEKLNKDIIQTYKVTDTTNGYMTNNVIFDKLNEEILKSYKIQFTAEITVYEETYNGGMGDFVNSFEFPASKEINIHKEQLSNDLKLFLCEYVNDVLLGESPDFETTETLIKNSLMETISDENYFVTFSQLVNNENDIPNQKEIEQWKANRIKLYEQYISVFVKINGTYIDNKLLFAILFEMKDESVVKNN